MELGLAGLLLQPVQMMILPSAAATKILTIHLCRRLCLKIPLPKLRLQRISVGFLCDTTDCAMLMFVWSEDIGMPFLLDVINFCRWVSTRNSKGKHIAGKG